MATKERTAFTSATMVMIDNTISALSSAMGSLIKCPVTADDIIDVMIPAEDKLILEQAARLGLRSGVYHSMVYMKLNDYCTLHINLTNAGFPLPKYLDGKYVNAIRLPDQMQAEIDDYALKKRAMSDHWTQVRALVGFLDDTCTSPQQVRYLLPCIIGLLSHSIQTAPLAKRLTGIPTLRNKPVVSPSVRDAIAAVQRTVTQALLIPKDMVVPNRSLDIIFSGSVSYEEWMPGYQMKRVNV